MCEIDDLWERLRALEQENEKLRRPRRRVSARSIILLAAGMGIGREFFVSAVSPSIMTASAAESLFDQLTALLGSTIVALALVGVLIALWAWLAGSSRSAAMVRGATESGFGALREAAEARGLSAGRFGRAVDRYRGAILRRPVAPTGPEARETPIVEEDTAAIARPG